MATVTAKATPSRTAWTWFFILAELGVCELRFSSGPDYLVLRSIYTESELRCFDLST